MKPDYKNWMPKEMIYAGLSATLIYKYILYYMNLIMYLKQYSQSLR